MGISQRRVQILCVEVRIAGAKKYASVWAVPKDKKPKMRELKKLSINDSGFF